ncbi:MAG: hypothetical protein AUK55_03455 [Syntrophobacteraceae bacterium CG2_30_61_12]|nr:MAG: hypothetical protein AUK55_03455 [Syntrophobacteraceae bacterium CG2_30_61_12]PIU31821.1 MAG: hypothetical protein COT06_06110 [Syntrophobacteraceae bacterium CG07_land_8_20_14_0_80_61_8]
MCANAPRRPGETKRKEVKIMKLNVVEILKRLPKTNCKECGEPTCMAYASKLMKKDASLDACPPLATPKYATARKTLHDMLLSAAA